MQTSRIRPQLKRRTRDICFFASLHFAWAAPEILPSNCTRLDNNTPVLGSPRIVVVICAGISFSTAQNHNSGCCDAFAHQIVTDGLRPAHSEPQIVVVGTT